MIVVIADDLTGAAEIGGLGLRYGLSSEIVTEAGLGSSADILIIATDTRSIPEQKALEVVEQVSNVINKIHPEIIYKKIDSVLRGHIVAELNKHLEIFNYRKALLVPANPNFGRVLTDELYYVNDKPIHETSFADDPEFPITSSSVYKMLRVEGNQIYTRKPGDDLPDSGIIAGETTTNEALHKWISRADNNTLLTGGAGLFVALLESLGHNPIAPNKTKDTAEIPSLFVCGSKHNKSRISIKKIKNNNGPVSYMPAEVIANASEIAFENWASEIVLLIKKNKTAIIAIDEDMAGDNKNTAAQLRDKKAAVIEKVLRQINIAELMIEGGSTAAAIINKLNFNRFFPVREISAGVIKMRVDNSNTLFLTLKPGSYDWPADTWNF